MPDFTKEQKQAINESGKNIIVSAGAGSGKTAVLSERALRIVKENVDVDRLLILTFTKAAAAEMKERIRNLLIENKFDDQVEKIDKAYITTFDSFSLGIVKKYYDILGLNKNISIIDTGIISYVKKNMIDDIFEEYYSSNNDKFIKLISDFCIKDDTVIKKSILDISNKIDMKYDKDSYLDTYIDAIFNDSYIDKTINDFILLLKKEINNIKENLENLSSEFKSDNYNKLYNCVINLISSNTYDEIYLNRSVDSFRMPPKSSEYAKRCKASIYNSVDVINSMCIYENLEDIKNTILATKDYVSIIIEILKELTVRLDKYKLEHNVYEFIDISKLAIKVVKENSEVRDELKNYFHEIMIDEYQDTNDLQEMFISEIANNNVYMVGDIKQSIYRFRNANPAIFKNKYDEYSKGNNGIKIDLTKNFRSRNEVLSDINLIFNLIMDDTIGGADYSNGHEMVYGNLSYTEKGSTNQNYFSEIYNYQYEKGTLFSKDEIEAFIVAKDIRDKVDSKYQVFDKKKCVLRDINYNDFVILMDRASKFDIYKRVLEYKNIPTTLLKDENLLKHNEIFLVKNIIKLISKVSVSDFTEEFKYSFMSVGRSYLFSYSDNYLFDVVSNLKIEDTEIYKILKDISNDLDNLSLVELFNRIVVDFKFYEKATLVGNINLIINDLEYIENLLSSLSVLDFDLEDVYNYLEYKIEEDDSIPIPASVIEEDSCKIMTIHKSKGLEYHICYYTGLHNRFNTDDLKNRIMFSNDYGIVLPYYINGFKDTIYKKMYSDKYYNEEISEKIRLFYVALTRAKEKMILVTSLDEENESNDSVDIETKLKYRSFLEMLKSIQDKISHLIKPINLDEVNITFDYKKRSTKNINDYIDFDKLNEKELVSDLNVDYEYIDDIHYSKEGIKLITEENKKNMEYGIYIHSILENLDFKNPDYSNIDSFIKDKLVKFLDNDLFKNIIDANIYKEYEFIDENNNIGIIDCMIEYKNGIDIIDYKLKNVMDDAYINQLNGYKNYIEKKTGKSVNTYLYSIIDNKLIKI